MLDTSGTIGQNKGDDSVSAEFSLSVPLSSPCFEGHFPAFKILPAVAQIDLVTRCAEAAFGCSRLIASSRRIKFSGVIPPGTPVRLKLAWREQDRRLRFTFCSPDGERRYSSGTVTLHPDKNPAAGTENR
jgi:3-hydroxymyristoyl/3-hydroxydecanoyl-(acyl carrier protein) dehydratase